MIFKESDIQASSYLPVFELKRGETVECVHFGAIAVVNSAGELVSWYGDPKMVSFLRSTSKPIQAIPFIEHGGNLKYDLVSKEIAIMCASHSGTDKHVEILKSFQSKIDVQESELLCGIHDPIDRQTVDVMRERNEHSTPNRHNCSGKHTGMLAFEKLIKEISGQAVESFPYIDVSHPVQKEMIRTFAEMCDIPLEQVEIGIDGCSVPTFAIPLQNGALAFARLCDPFGGGILSDKRTYACQTITQAMMSCPEMIGGPDRFDTRLMEVTRGRIVSKGGAEGYQGIGIIPGSLGEGSPGIGITLKISDGDARNKVCSAVTLEVLRQLDVLTSSELEELSEFGPSIPILNWRKMEIGQGYPTFSLESTSPNE